MQTGIYRPLLTSARAWKLVSFGDCRFQHHHHQQQQQQHRLTTVSLSSSSSSLMSSLSSHCDAIRTEFTRHEHLYVSVLPTLHIDVIIDNIHLLSCFVIKFVQCLPTFEI